MGNVRFVHVQNPLKLLKMIIIFAFFVLLIDYIPDHQLDTIIIVSHIFASIHLLHWLPPNILHFASIFVPYVLQHSNTLINIILMFSTIQIIYCTVIRTISIKFTLDNIASKKLVSNISKLFLTSPFQSHKDIVQAFYAVP